jgi:hypothetical protein
MPVIEQNAGQTLLAVCTRRNCPDAGGLAGDALRGVEFCTVGCGKALRLRPCELLRSAFCTVGPWHESRTTARGGSIIEPNVWSGFADAFILASTPHLEEAYRVGEEVLPLVRGRPGAAPLPAVG